MVNRSLNMLQENNDSSVVNDHESWFRSRFAVRRVDCQSPIKSAKLGFNRPRDSLDLFPALEDVSRPLFDKAAAMFG